MIRARRSESSKCSNRDPLAGQRILRMFTNVNPDGKARAWKVGEPFEDVAKRFVPQVRNL